jgi:hypothetical protein
VQLPLSVGGRLDRGAASGEVHLQRGPFRAGLGSGQMGAGQRIAGGAFGVDRIGLGAGSSLRPHWTIQFEDQLAGLGQVTGQSGAVAPAALQRPGTQPGVLLDHHRQLGVAVRIGRHRRPRQHRRCGHRPLRRCGCPCACRRR